MYLHASSSHPKTVKHVIRYALGIRVKRICSEETNYNNRREELIKRRYSKGTIENQLKKVDMLKRENLPQYNTKKQNNRVPLVLTYSDIQRKNMKIYTNQRE
jgi:hypothetical protein